MVCAYSQPIAALPLAPSYHSATVNNRLPLCAPSARTISWGDRVWSTAVALPRFCLPAPSAAPAYELSSSGRALAAAAAFNSARSAGVMSHGNHLLKSETACPPFSAQAVK